MERNGRLVQCICGWADLLGYGAPFSDSLWNLSDERCKKNIERLDSVFNYLHGGLSLSMDAIKLMFNDSIAITQDYDPNTPNITKLFFFLDAFICDYLLANKIDMEKGFPGIRGVVSIGQRFEADNTSITEDGMIIKVYHPRAFQMNTAFSKAYIIEGSGKKMGITGPCLYIDSDVFDIFQRKEIVSENEDTLTIRLYGGLHYYSNFELDRETIKYDYMGIKTNLYRLKQYDANLL